MYILTIHLLWDFSFLFLQCDTVDPRDVDKVAKGVLRALATYGTGAMREMIQNCMAQDLSWKVRILKYSCLTLVFENLEYQTHIFKFGLNGFLN